MLEKHQVRVEQKLVPRRGPCKHHTSKGCLRFDLGPAEVTCSQDRRKHRGRPQMGRHGKKARSVWQWNTCLERSLGGDQTAWWTSDTCESASKLLGWDVFIPTFGRPFSVLPGFFFRLRGNACILSTHVTELVDKSIPIALMELCRQSGCLGDALLGFFHQIWAAACLVIEVLQ